MKGLTYCWFVSNKSYFIVAAVVFAATLGFIFGILPMLDFLDAELRNLLVFIFCAAVMTIPAESLAKNLERYLKNGFADYLLSSMNKKTFVNSLIVRELICFGYSLVSGYIILLSFVYVTKTPMTAELIMLIFFGAVFMNGIDLICMPLTIRYKNAEKAGLILGFFVGILVMIFMVYVNVINDGGFSEMLITMDFRIAPMLILTGIVLAACVIAHLITLRMVKRGDVC